MLKVSHANVAKFKSPPVTDVNIKAIDIIEKTFAKTEDDGSSMTFHKNFRNSEQAA